MFHKIGRIIKLTLGTTEQTLDCQLEGFMIQNLDGANTVYFKEKSDDNVACSATNGFAVAPGVTIPVVFCARTLSLVASAGSTDARLIFMDIG